MVMVVAVLGMEVEGVGPERMKRSAVEAERTPPEEVAGLEEGE